MASTSSFDVTTGVDYMEVHNAVDQTTKEITQRFDFKGLKVEITLNQKDKKISQDDERKGLEEVQKITDQHIGLIDDVQKKKDSELLGK